MPSEYSYVHGQPGYWRVRFDDWNGWEAPHIHAAQGDRELQVYTQTLEIKNQNGRFSLKKCKQKTHYFLVLRLLYDILSTGNIFSI